MSDKLDVSIHCYKPKTWVEKLYAKVSGLQYIFTVVEVHTGVKDVSGAFYNSPDGLRYANWRALKLVAGEPDVTVGPFKEVCHIDHVTKNPTNKVSHGTQALYWLTKGKVNKGLCTELPIKILEIEVTDWRDRLPDNLIKILRKRMEQDIETSRIRG